MSWTSWENSMRSCCTCRSLFHRRLPPDAFEPGDEADAQHKGVHRRQPAHQHLLIARTDVEAGARRPAYEGIGGDGHRRPGQAEPEGREDHSKQRESRVVGHEDVAVEPGAEGDAGRGQAYVHGAEEEHPAPRDRPVCQEPEVDRAVERHQRDHQEHGPHVVGVPEARPVGYLEGANQHDEPATPDRNPCRIWHDIRVGAYGRREPIRYGSHVSPQQVQTPVPGHAPGCALPSRTESILQPCGHGGVYH